MSKIALMPGVEPNAEIILHEALEKVRGGMNEVLVVVQNDQGIEVLWSNMDFGALAYAHRVAGIHIDKKINESLECDCGQA